MSLFAQQQEEEGSLPSDGEWVHGRRRRRTFTPSIPPCSVGRAIDGRTGKEEEEEEEYVNASSKYDHQENDLKVSLSSSLFPSSLHAPRDWGRKKGTVLTVVRVGLSRATTTLL